MHQISEDLTQIYLIKENIKQGKRLILKGNRKSKPFDPDRLQDFYIPRAIHIQTMALLGLNLEYLIKLIIKKRGYSIFEVDHVMQVNNKNSIVYKNKTISLSNAIKLFKKSSEKGYFDEISTYTLHEAFMGYKELNPINCLSLMTDLRNNYIHNGDPKGEYNSIIWYTHNLIIWIVKKEYPEYFSRFGYIGNSKFRELFKQNSHPRTTNHLLTSAF